MFEFKFPDIGEGLIEGLLVKWTVNVGDVIKKDQTVAQVGTDKAVVDLPSPVAGTVAKLLYKEGDMMPVGKVIIHIDENATTTSASSPQPQPQSQPAVQTQKPEAPVVLQTQPLSQQPAPQPVTPISAKSSAILATPQVRAYANAHQVDLATIKPTGQHGEITMNDISVGAVQQIVSHIQREAQPIGHAHDILATPSVRKLAREMNVDLNNVVGTGDHGHITADDVKNATSQPKVNAVVTQQPTPAVQPQQVTSTPSARISTPQSTVVGTPVTTAAGPVEIIQFTRLRQLISQHLTKSYNTVVHATMTDNANVTKLVALRERYKDAAAKQNIKLTYLPFIVKAICAALKKHPIFNATLDEEKQQITLKKYYNVGIATDTPQGLLVPVVLDADKLSIYEIATRISDLAQKAKENKLSPKESNDGTFTITSVGALGVEAFTAIVNYPQVAILGVGRIEDRAEVIAGEIKIQKMVTLSFTFDHRVADGADAARLMQTLISYLQDPELLLLEVA